MKFSTLSLLASQVLPVMATAWMLDRPFSNYGLLPISPMRILREQHELANRIAKEMSGPSSSSLLINEPRYELKDEENKFAVAVDLPGIAPNDINISFDSESKLLSITGHREFSNERGSYSERFSQAFYLDPSVDVDNISANLEHGVLVVSAPKDQKKLESNVRTIPISSPSNEDRVKITGGDKTKSGILGSEKREGEGLLEKVKGFVSSEKSSSGEGEERESYDLDSGEDF
ncbi:hypothetical protein MPSEU_000454100 [Mayamaea pseudoterrestris]|nr:hypothetical protein MPSEU_000454100 [Mayamaea pseudoterrestris]